MRIDLRQPYKSIQSLTTEELPDFAVLIGRNGAGKTQLLAALKEGQAVVPGVDVKEIELYDMVSFHPPNAGSANRHANQFAKAAANRYLVGLPDDHSLIEVAKDIFNEHADEIERTSGRTQRDEFTRKLRGDIRRLPDFSIFPPNGGRSSPYNRALYDRVMKPLETTGGRRQSSNQSVNRFNGNAAVLLSAAMKITGKLPHELTHDDILHASHYEGDTLTNSISAVFATYTVDQFTWAHKRIEGEHIRFADLIAEYRAKYPPPWTILREILANMRDAARDNGLFNFDFSDPDGYALDMHNYEQFSFKAQLTNREHGGQVRTRLAFLR